MKLKYKFDYGTPVRPWTIGEAVAYSLIDVFSEDQFDGLRRTLHQVVELQCRMLEILHASGKLTSAEIISLVPGFEEMENGKDANDRVK